MHPSARTYTPLALRLYDFVVLQFSNTFAWRCPTDTALLPFFIQHLGQKSHLDVGVGTGYYPSQAAHLLHDVDVSLLDLNPATLEKAAGRLEGAGYPRSRVKTITHDVFTPLPDELKGQYDAVSLFYLLHCLPGELSEKARIVFAQVAPALRQGGILYGATILGTGVQHNWIGKMLMRVYNKKGIFGNTEDSEAELRGALEDYFEEVEIHIVGTVALFVGKTGRARYPQELKRTSPKCYRDGDQY